MDRQALIEQLLDHYEHPRNYGPLADADVVVPGWRPDCGDRVTIYVKLTSDHQALERMTFEGAGCSISQAAASILSELVVGQSLATLQTLDEQWMIGELGREVVINRLRCATLALNTLKAALATIENNAAAQRG